MLTTQLSSKLATHFIGDLVVSYAKGHVEVPVQIRSLSDILIKVSFTYKDQLISMRAILSEESNDVHMVIQEKVTEQYILNGVSGFLCQKPNIHGGYIDQLKGMYFHILLNHFSGPYQEFYFFGKIAEPKAKVL
jgi:hypothetical protein